MVYESCTSRRSLVIITLNKSVGASSSATVTDVAGKKSLDVNVTEITLDAANDSIEIRNKAMSLLVDKTTTASITYIGEAAPGTSESSANWRIFILDNSTSITKKKWADGNGNFDNIWSNRASLTYA